MLMLAASKGRADLEVVLMENGADATITDKVRHHS